MNLPKEIYRFFHWWILDVPQWLFEVSKRVLILVNNELSFALSIKMFFVPLFHDFTWIGRLMGVVYRFIKIILGIVVLTVLLALGLIANIGWFALSVYLFILNPIYLLVFGVILFFLWGTVYAKVPWKKVSKVKKEVPKDSFRPIVKLFLKKMEKNKEKGLDQLFKTDQIKIIIKKLELPQTDFEHSIVNLAIVDLKHLEKDAFSYAVEHKTRYVELEHLFLALVVSIENYDNFLDVYSLNFEVCRDAVRWVVGRREFLAKIFWWQPDYEIPTIGGVDRAMTGRVTPKLDVVSNDFTNQAQRGYIPPIFGHADEQKQVVDLISSSDRDNVLIIGPPGCGKTSLVKGIAQRIIKGTKEGSLRFKRVISIESGSLISGAKTAGEISAKVKEVMDEVRGSRGIILFFDEIHNLVVAGAEGTSTIFSILEPYVSSGDIQIIGATNLENYRKYIEPNGSFSGLFQIVEIGPTSNEETFKILEDVSIRLETKFNVDISFVALHRTVELTQKLVHERVFPDKALDILTRTVGRESKGDGYIIGEDIAKTVSNITHVPVTSISETEADKLLNIEKHMKEYVIGQDESLEKIGKAMKRGRVGIRNENRPIASFLFVGTTGVGKTETAKTLARLYFGDEEAMIRLDMSEYQQADSINRLIGSPDGKVSGQLTDKVRSAPFALILLDEIEKAYSEVLLAFLQVLDDGRLTDSKGRLVDFSNTIIIATSNVGTRSIQDVSNKGGSFEKISEVANKDVREHFAPEFLNRFSGIIVYRPLSPESVRKIAHLMLGRVTELADDKGIKLTYKQELIDQLVERGYSPEWGARPLIRVIEDSVETYLAEKILEKKFKRGDNVELGLEVFGDT